MIWQRGPDYWAAFGLTFLLMVFWVWTPLGEWVASALHWIGVQLKNTPLAEVGQPLEEGYGAVFAWPITGIVFFSITHALLRRRRLKREASVPSSPPGSPEEISGRS
jgi:DNA mismatch repair protein MutH